MIRVGHVLAVLAEMEPESVSCVCTSPPYWSLRKYDAPDAVWGDQLWCPHPWGFVSDRAAAEGYVGTGRWQHDGVSREETPEAWGHVKVGRNDTGRDIGGRKGNYSGDEAPRAEMASTGGTCPACGAWKGQFGLEPTIELYVEHMIEFLRAVRRVLRKDGVLWLNLGDGYAGGSVVRGDGKWPDKHDPSLQRGAYGRVGTLKPKDLVLMPERVALAAQQDGWWVRKRIVWSKTNAMPESCTDRPTSAHETIWMLTRSARYWYDQEAVRETGTSGPSDIRKMAEGKNRIGGKSLSDNGTLHKANMDTNIGQKRGVGSPNRNMRDVWTFPTAQTPEAHFATFPEELPRRCILASCPRDVCAKCGHARERLTETEYIKNRPSAGDDPRSRKEDKLSTLGASEDYSPHRGYRGNNLLADVSTTGWTDCACDPADRDYQPGITLDPFLGIGTTGVVARRLGRRFIGIELSEKYAAIAERKIALALHEVKPAPRERDTAQGSLPL